MKKYQLDLTILANRPVSADAFLLELYSDVSLTDVVPGQFAELLVTDSPVTFLRRPISIHDAGEHTVSFLIRKAGRGTERLSRLNAGEKLNAILPLGNGFSYTKETAGHPLLVGGGVGIAPLYLLGRKMLADGIRPTFLFGGKQADNLLRIEEFNKLGDVYVTTEDASAGEKGFVTDHSILNRERFDAIYACGPTPMMKAVARYASARAIACQVSLEHKMACGIGACLCCVEETKEGNLCVCKEGPVFSTERLLWQN